VSDMLCGHESLIDKVKEQAERAEAERESVSAELRIIRIENQRLALLIQEQDKFLRASDTAKEKKLADGLAEALSGRMEFGYLPGDGEARNILNDWRRHNGLPEISSSEWNKRVS